MQANPPSENHAGDSVAQQLVVSISSSLESEEAIKRVQASFDVAKEHFIFVRKVAHEENDVSKVLPQKVGQISRKALSRQEWDRAYEHRLDLSPRDIVVARQRDQSIEVFEQADYDVIFAKMKSMFQVTKYNFADPPSIYPARSRGERLASHKLADDIYEAIRRHYGKVDVEHAYICGDPVNLILRIVDVGKTEENPMLPSAVEGRETITSEGYSYPVIGVIDDNEVIFGDHASDKELSRYTADGTLKWCWWSQAPKAKRRNRKRQPKNKKRKTEEAGETVEAAFGEGSSAQASNGSKSNDKTEDGDTPTKPDHIATTSSQVEDNSKTKKADKTGIDQKSVQTLEEAETKPAHAIDESEISQKTKGSDTFTKPICEARGKSSEKPKSSDTRTQSDHVTGTSPPTADNPRPYIDVAVEQIRADLRKLKGVGKRVG